MMALLSWIQPTDLQLCLIPDIQEEFYVWYSKPEEKSIARDNIGPGREVIAIVMLHWYGVPVKLTSKHLLQGL